MLRSCLIAALVIGALAGGAVPVAAAGPPEGELMVDGKGPTIGVLGTFCFSGEGVEGCQDAEWIIPPRGPHAAQGAQLTFRLSDDRPITSWDAVVAPAVAGVESMPEPDSEWLDGVEDTSVELLSFTGPAAGDWVLRVSAHFEGGGAQYYYRLKVGMPDTATVTPVLPPAPDPLGGFALVISAAAGAIVGWRLKGLRAPM